MAALARELSNEFAVLEPFQTEMTVLDQIEELRAAIDAVNAAPVIVIGHSWDAWLAYMFASRYHRHVSKLILVGSGGFRPGDGELADRERLSRLPPAQQAEAGRIQKELATAESEQRESLFERLGCRGVVHEADPGQPMSFLEDGAFDVIVSSGTISYVIDWAKLFR